MSFHKTGNLILPKRLEGLPSVIEAFFNVLEPKKVSEKYLVFIDAFEIDD